MKPGDILRAMNGKTIEVINTDAEGCRSSPTRPCIRARELGATKIVDAATLTGACVIALGHAASGVMSNDDVFVERFLKVAGDVERALLAGSLLYDDFDRQIKSDIADIEEHRRAPWRGIETAGAFLQEFLSPTCSRIHFDIAGTKYLDGESSYLAKAWPARRPGTLVRAFVAPVEDLAKNGATATAVNGKPRAKVAAHQRRKFSRCGANWQHEQRVDGPARIFGDMMRSRNRAASPAISMMSA